MDKQRMIGKTVSHYKILEKLGAGGMGVVYKAEDTKLKRTAALKFLSPELTRDEEAKQRFMHEAQAASALEHQNICTIYEVNETQDGQIFIAMAYYSGETLKSKIARGQFKFEEAIDITIQIAAGLARAHEADIIHRDIKPGNIVITDRGEVKIIDFGLAKLGGQTKLTKTGTTMGTVAYMSPEQAQGISVDHRTDIWVLGVVLYEMLTGELPFKGEYEQAVVYSILNEESEPVTALRTDVPQALQNIIEKALNKNPSSRYQNAVEILTDLKKIFVVDSSPAKFSIQKSQDTQDTVSNNLPLQLTNFIGRKREIKEVKKLLPTVRLLTLTGTAGTGKTRLSLEVAADLFEEFENGVLFVPLARISDPGLVTATIAQMLGVKEVGEKPIIESLKDFLQGKQMLLLLDSFEHLVAARNLVVEILSACPRLKVLVTSREPLHVHGEHQFPLPPLELPNLNDLESIEVLSKNEAIALFIQRARGVKPNFALNKDNAHIVAGICIHLDGLPLAIELAAARSKLFPPQAMLTRLKNRLKLLTGGPRDLPERQQTLRAAIEWSYDLLNEDEKMLLRHLSVFVGGCTLEAAEAVCNTALKPSKSKADSLTIEVLEGLDSLVDKSLLRQEEQPNGEPRFVMLETIREFGLECLTASGEIGVYRRAHIEFFLKFAEDAQLLLIGPQQVIWLERLEQEHNNLRAALDWTKGTGEEHLGLQLAAALWRFWETRGYLTEGRESLKKLLALEDTSKPSKLRSKVLYAAGVIADAQGDYKAARSYFEEHLAINRKLGDKWGIASSINNLGIITLREGDYVAARSLYEETVAIWRELDNKGPLALALNNLGNVANQQGDYTAACSLHEESMEIFKELGDKRGIAWSLNHLGGVARNQQDYARACTLYEESLAIFRQLGIKWGIANLLTDLGNLNLDEEDYAAARLLYEESLQIFKELGDRRGIARLLESFAGLAVAQAQPEHALQLAGAAGKLREAIGAPLPQTEKEKFERLIKPTQKVMSAKASIAALEQGRIMTLDEVIEYALTVETA